jgi:hypothetical protein
MRSMKKKRLSRPSSNDCRSKLPTFPQREALAGLGKVNQDLIRDWKPVKLIEWHREKAGTIERVHEGMKNALAAVVLPSKYFGAKAAWRRLAVIAYHVLTALKRLALPAGFIDGPNEATPLFDFPYPGSAGAACSSAELALATAIEELAMCLDAVRLLPFPA